ncbi:hypothetical protein [Geodermatophilus dictyosporus]|nr:hypothetical protein [Geodermatophilus dictyosporus]
MTDEQPVEPDAVIGADGAALARRGAREGASSRLPEQLVPTLGRLATAGPVLAASAVALTAVAAARVLQVVGRTAWQVAGRDAQQQPITGLVEVTWTRVEIRLVR